jgi:hypothetical protein
VFKIFLLTSYKRLKIALVGRQANFCDQQYTFYQHLIFNIRIFDCLCPGLCLVIFLVLVQVHVYDREHEHGHRHGNGCGRVDVKTLCHW